MKCIYRLYRKSKWRWAVAAVLPGLLLGTPGRAQAGGRDRVLPRLDGGITVDGSLSDAAWSQALVIEEFFEISPGDNTVPVVRTRAFVGYDDRYFYAALHCHDPRPEEIRAPLSDRDSVFGDQDFVQFDVDTQNDEKSSFIFRVNPRGVKGDAIFSEATGLDDFSPDFSFEAQGRIVSDGWVAEFRVPLSTLRYPNAPVQTWGITFYRNYPRQFRRQMTSLPIPRGANCWLCYDLKLTQIGALPPSRYALIVPFTTAQFDSGGGGGEPVSTVTGGVDVKWIPHNDITVDATYNPDFAQVEADVPQIGVNRRFALFFPEKRVFFLESSDLLATPLAVVSTRSITSPAWGARLTGHTGDASYTLLLAEDEGGGTRILPGPRSSRLQPQNGRSLAAVGRIRYSLGNSFAGLVLTDREEEGGHNRLFGPDLQWRPTETSQISAQWLLSKSELNGGGPEAAGTALSLDWLYSAPSRFFQATFQRLGPEFRADNGFIPQVGIHRRAFSGGRRFYPEGWLHQVQLGFVWDQSVEIGDRTVSRSTYPTLSLKGKWNSDIQFEYHLREQVRTGGGLIEADYLAFDFRIQPSRFFSTVQWQGSVGRQVDFVNERVGDGGVLSLLATLRPGIHLDAEVRAERQWLNLQGRRLFTADAAQAKVTYNFTPRVFLRTIGQYERTRRDPGLYSGPMEADEGVWSSSILFAYRFDWQTVFYAGYSTSRDFGDSQGPGPEQSHLFIKIAYAFEPRF